MAYKYKHFIPQNTAPRGANSIGAYKDGVKVADISLGRMTPHSGTKRYSFGVVSDTHLCPENTVNNTGAIVSARFDSALTWFEEQGVSFVAHCGDMTNVGFENPKGTYNPVQYEEYLRIRNLHPNLPIYCAAGNHESYNANICDYEQEYKHYIGNDIQFTVEHNGDVFIFMGMPKTATLYVDGSVLPVPELAWLETQLSDNKDKRCFVFIHPYMDGDSGDTLDKNPNDLLPIGYVTNIIKGALSNHGRAVLFHGHSHFMPSMQEIDIMTNYTDVNGFPSVHIPSLGWAAYVSESGEYVKDVNEGFGAIVDVYDDCVVVNGRDFVRNEWSPLGVYRIKTY